MPKARPDELIIPPAATKASDAFELLRVWAAGGECHTSIRSDLQGGTESFGIMLCDLARHGALLYSEREGVTPLEAAKRIKAAFEAEWRAVEWPVGGILK
jgi:hypothetical protein